LVEEVRIGDMFGPLFNVGVFLILIGFILMFVIFILLISRARLELYWSLDHYQ